MPIMGITQSNIIEINNEIRLRKYDGQNDFALNWYRYGLTRVNAF